MNYINKHPTVGNVDAKIRHFQMKKFGYNPTSLRDLKMHF